MKIENNVQVRKALREVDEVLTTEYLVSEKLLSAGIIDPEEVEKLKRAFSEKITRENPNLSEEEVEHKTLLSCCMEVIQCAVEYEGDDEAPNEFLSALMKGVGIPFKISFPNPEKTAFLGKYTTASSESPEKVGSYELFAHPMESVGVDLISTKQREHHYGRHFHVAVVHSGFFFPMLKKQGGISLGSAFASGYSDLLSYEAIARECKGDVLVMRAETGVLADILSREEDISSVTVVEPEKEVVKLIETYILPKMVHPEKVSFVCEDPSSYLSKVKEEKRDFDNLIINWGYGEKGFFKDYFSLLALWGKREGVFSPHKDRVFFNLQLGLCGRVIQQLLQKDPSLSSELLSLHLFKKLFAVPDETELLFEEAYKDVKITGGEELRSLFEVESVWSALENAALNQKSR